MKRNPITAILNVSIAMVLLLVSYVSPSRAQKTSGRVVSSGQALVRQGTVRAQGPMRSQMRKTPPDRPPHEPDEDMDHVRMDPPTDPSVRAEDIRPTSPETVVNVVPKAPTVGRQEAPQAAGTFTLYRNTSLANAPVVGGAAQTSSTTSESSLGSNGRVVFWTQNWYAAVSGDRGQNFTYINSFDNFPADGTNDPVNRGFCCDQIAYYERTRGLTLWLLQYNPDNNTNTQRLAVARSQADVLNNNWLFYDFTPAVYGFNVPPTGATGFWLDFPDMAVSDSFLYLTTNVFPRVPVAGPGVTLCPGTTCNRGATPPQTCCSVGAVIARIQLDQLAQGGALNFGFYTDSHAPYRCTQGAHGTMYWGSHNSNTQIRIYRWAENSSNIAWDDVDHAAFNTTPAAGMTATSPDGTNFAGFADTRVLGAYVSNGVIGFMWNAAQSAPPATAFPFPHVWVVRFNENDRTLLSEGQVFNNSYAFLYPSVQVNDRGHLGGMMAWGGGTLFPNGLAWIADDFNNGTITPLENFTFAAGNSGPASNRWGDYSTTRINVPYGNTWVGGGYVLIGGTGNANVVPSFVWFGRERDTPPANNTVYVDLANTSAYQDGSSAHPYKTVTAGHFAATPGDTLIIRAGDYFETPRLNTAVTVRNEGGIVRILPP